MFWSFSCQWAAPMFAASGVGSFAPLVAVNTSYHPTARNYTLFHEVGHLLTRTDSASSRFVLPSSQEPLIERWCERFVAAFLLPDAELRATARGLGATEASPVSDVDLVRRLANRFKTSSRATAIRLDELGLAANGLYAAVVENFAQFDWNDQGGGGGGQPAIEKRLGQLGTCMPELPWTPRRPVASMFLTSRTT